MLESLWSILTVFIWVAFAILIIAVSIGVFTSPAWFPKLLNWVADRNKWWSPVKALPLEGEMRFIVEGNPQGPFAMLLESVSTHWYDQLGDIFLTGVSATKTYNNWLPDSWNMYLEGHGLAYTGFNRYVLQKKIKYTKWEKLKGSSNFGLVEKIREGASIYFNYNMATRLDKAETKGNFPVSVTVNMTVQLIRPRMAVFYTGGWEDQVVAAVLSKLRHYVSSRNVEELRVEMEQLGVEGLAKMLTDKALNDELEVGYGIRIIRAEFIDFDDVSGDKADSDAIKAKERARLNLEAEITAAEGRKKIAEEQGNALVMMAQKEAEAAKHKAEAIKTEYTARVTAGRQFAGDFRRAEAIENTKLTALGGDFLVSADKK